MVLKHIHSQASTNSSTNLLLEPFVPSISLQVRLSLMLTERFSSSWFLPTRSPNSSSYYLLTYLPSSIISSCSFEPGIFEYVPISRAVSYEASSQRRCLLANAKPLLSVVLLTNRGPQSPPWQRKQPTTLVLCFQKRQNTDVDEPPVHLGGREQ